MEFTVNKADLLAELSLVERIVEERSTIPILSHVLFEADAGRLRLTATDLELAVRTSLPAAITVPGAATIPGAKFFALAKLWPDEVVKVKLLESRWIEIGQGKRKYKMVGLDHAQFPAVAEFPERSAISIPGATLARLVDKTSFAISNEESRYTLAGALLLLKKDSATMVATDGHRLSLVEVVGAFDVGKEDVRELVPKKLLSELAGLIGDGPGLSFARTDASIFFRSSARTISSRRLTGQFPNYEAVLPKTASRRATLDHDVLSATIARVLQMADKSAVKFSFSAAGLSISSASPEHGDGVEEIDAAYSGEPLAIGLNGDYVLDYLRHSDGPVLLLMNDDRSATEFRPPEGNHSRHIVMPMAIK